VAGAAAGVTLANTLSSTVLRYVFAGLMLVMAARLVHGTLRHPSLRQSLARKRPGPKREDLRAMATASRTKHGKVVDLRDHGTR
jgi:uncharacterized membrane protein YfcA